MENKSNHFGHGLVLGVIVGVTAYFFLGTKKGKKLLRNLTEESIDVVSEFGEVATDDAAIEQFHGWTEKGKKLIKGTIHKTASEESSD